MTDRIQIVIPVFDGMTALDAIGPYEVLQRLPMAGITFAGKRPGQIRADSKMLGLAADAALADLPRPDVIVMPGGPGTRAMLHDEEMLAWVRDAHAHTRYTTSVCSGSLVLAAAGLLRGLPATTHYSVRDMLARLGAVPDPRRVVENLPQRIITAAGVSSGIDMALRLAELLAGPTAAQAAQLMIEYDPQPPFDAGSPGKASPEVHARAREYAVSRG